MDKHPIFKHALGEDLAMFFGDTTFLNLPHCTDCEDADIAVVGIPFDLATSNRPGTRFGPRAIRTATKHLSWQPAYNWDYDLLKTKKIVDLGDLTYDFGLPNSFHSAITHATEKISQKNTYCLTLGGDHYITYPILEALTKKYGSIALVQFDAHSDTWPSAEGRMDHGCGMYMATKQGFLNPNHSIQVGIRTLIEDPMGIQIMDSFEAERLSPENIADQILNRVGNQPAYLSFDIDCLDPAFAPGTGTPVCGGLSTGKCLSILKQLKPIHFVGADIVEVSPPYDHSEITALAAATIAYYEQRRCQEECVKQE